MTFTALCEKDECIHVNIFFLYFSLKTYVVGTHRKGLYEAFLMSTHNISFCKSASDECSTVPTGTVAPLVVCRL